MKNGEDEMTKCLSLNELEDIIGLSSDTLRVYLGRFIFTKYVKNQKKNNYRQIVYSFEEDFVKDLEEFLIAKRHRGNAERLLKYWKEHRYD